MVLIALYIAAILLTYTLSSRYNRGGNTFGVAAIGGVLALFLMFVFANAFANEVKTFTPITSPIVREVVNNEVVLSFTTAPDDKKWSLPSDTKIEVGFKDMLVNTDSVAPSPWISLMSPTIPDQKSLVVAP